MPGIAKLLHEYFYLSQILVGGLFLGVAWLLLRPKAPESNFRVREADLRKNAGGPLGRAKSQGKAGPDPLAQARLQQPLRIGGISIQGPPHEILGVRPTASLQEIQTAYRERMKQYHPDRVGRPGSREWTDAQKIAEAINRAKDELLRRRQSGR